MMTSLTETKEIEAYLSGKLNDGETVVFEAKLILDQTLKDKVSWQKKTYDLIRVFGRKKLKSELEIVHQQLFTEPKHQNFREKVFQLFSKR